MSCTPKGYQGTHPFNPTLLQRTRIVVVELLSQGGRDETRDDATVSVTLT